MALRRRLKMSQAELAARMECSAMTVSRWERGLQKPTADHYLKLGKLAGKEKGWFFWHRAGLQMADIAHVLPRTKATLRIAVVTPLEKASAETRVGLRAAEAPLVPVPLLDTFAGTHGSPGDRKRSLDMIPSSQLLGAPSKWCPNPGYTSLMAVRGHSMEPLIHDGDIIAVDSFQTDQRELDGKVVVVTHEEHGLGVSHFRRYDGVELLESENHEYSSVVLSKSGWQILGKVLWWISEAP